MNYKLKYQHSYEIGQFSTKEVRQILNVGTTTLNRWMHAGYLVPVKVGGRNRYPVADVERVFNGNRE